MWIILWQEVQVRNTELTSYHQPEEFRKGQKETPHVLLISQYLYSLVAFILAEQSVPHQKGPWVRIIGQRQPGYGNPVTIKSESANQATEQSSWGLLPSISPPRCPFQIKSLFLAACVSPWTIYFQLLDKSPLSGPGRVSLPATKWLLESLSR